MGRIKGGKVSRSPDGVSDAAAPPGDAAKLDRLRAAIEDGSFAIDFRGVASKLVERSTG